MAPPNLKDPAEHAEYRRELQGVARGVRLAGLWLVVAALGLAAAHRLAFLDVPLWIVMAVGGIGVMLMLTGVAARTRYHALRMRE